MDLFVFFIIKPSISVIIVEILIRIVNPVSLSFILDLTYFFFWALESFASLFWLAVAVSTSKLFLLLYVSHCLADM